MRLVKVAMAALLLVPATAWAVSAAEPGALNSSETVPCPSSITKGATLVASGTEVEGQTYSCGVVTVPEDHAKPDGRTIELFYLKLHSTADTPAPEPLIYLAGGPGSSGANELATNPILYTNINQIRESRDIIAYDQRGAGYSNYLLCAPFEAAIGVLEDRDRNPQIAETVAKLQGEDLGIGYGALVSNLCGVVTKTLAGVDLGQYNSAASARDIPLLANALGYADGYSLYGTSYGTRLAQYAMRFTPEHIKSVVIDGVSGVAVPNTLISFAKGQESYVALFQQCAADAACAAAYPDLATRFGALLEKLQTTPLVFDPPIVTDPQLAFALPPVLDKIDPSFFVKLASLDNLVLAGGFAGLIPRMILAAEQEDADFFRSSSLSAKPSTEEQPPVVVQNPGDTEPLAVDQPLFAVPFTTLLALAQGVAAQADPGLDTQWISIALNDLTARFGAGEDQADLIEDLLNLAVLPNSGTTADLLSTFADQHLSESAAAAADAVVAAMSRNDVRSTMWGIQDVAMLLGSQPDARGDSQGMQSAFNCSDEIAFLDESIPQTYLDQSPYPQLVAFPIEVNGQFILSCLAYPTTLDKSVTEPVVSDIPTLVYLGQLDTQTPVSWGREVAKGLSDATVVEWANQGHIAATHDDKTCAGDIAAAFLDDPSTAPDLSCAASDAYKVQFVLPQ